MNKITATSDQIQCLKKKITQCYRLYQFTDEQKIYAKFDRTLFSEDYQTFAFYRAEITQTLTQLEKLQDQEQYQCQFYTKKLLAQLQALLDAASSPHFEKKLRKEKTTSPYRVKQKNEIHQLPPRERLEKYYEALQALNDKIALQRDQYYLATDELEKQQLQRHITHTQQRKARCLEAIAALEEYLSLTK
ncbi:primosomal replication protein PriC [Avibacterium paragallinarum]|uniref:primosomal replication protein PriC n=1 Tax=Avibacterium paragallinarum TaxID=728 RepID=UPI00397AF7F5